MIADKRLPEVMSRAANSAYRLGDGTVDQDFDDRRGAIMQITNAILRRGSLDTPWTTLPSPGTGNGGNGNAGRHSDGYLFGGCDIKEIDRRINEWEASNG